MQPELTTLGAYDVTEASLYRATNDFADELRERDDDYIAYKQQADRLGETDDLIELLEQLNMGDIKMIPKDEKHWRIYERVRELAQEYDTDFRTKLCKQTQECLDAVYEIQAKILPLVHEARRRLKRWEAIEDYGGEDST